jgi:hypothetical protein
MAAFPQQTRDYEQRDRASPALEILISRFNNINNVANEYSMEKAETVKCL